MKIWFFVEGESERLALAALWMDWIGRLRQAGWGIAVIPLDNKSRYLRKIGDRAAEKLAATEEDLVVGLPDLYPVDDYRSTRYEHDGVAQLKKVQARLVRRSLLDVQKIPERDIDTAMRRFFPTAFKHDMEMLLLAAEEQLRSTLKVSGVLRGWHKPVEDQDNQHPPKSVVKHLYLSKSPRKRAYRETTDPSIVLKQVQDLRTIIYTSGGQVNCPVFKEMLDWVGAETNVAAYNDGRPSP